ncbi:MAG: hypothetical protein V4690_04345 [Patescibacteria group bacterium]
MFELIEKLRSKPEATKKRVALLGALLFSLCIFGVWLSVVFPQIKNPPVVEEKGPATPSPLSAFTDNIADGFSSLQETFSDAKDSLTGVISELEQQSNVSTTTVEGNFAATTTATQ